MFIKQLLIMRYIIVESSIGVVVVSVGVLVLLVVIVGVGVVVGFGLDFEIGVCVWTWFWVGFCAGVEIFLGPVTFEIYWLASTDLLSVLVICLGLVLVGVISVWVIVMGFVYLSRLCSFIAFCFKHTLYSGYHHKIRSILNLLRYYRLNFLINP